MSTSWLHREKGTAHVVNSLAARMTHRFPLMVYSGPDYNNGLIIYPIRRSFSDSHDFVDSRYLLL
jgi:hypothetical protein